MTLVMKFGGTSVGSTPAIRNTAELIQQTTATWGAPVVVVSAMGSQPVKVTDLLLQGARAAVTGDEQTYRGVAEKLHQLHFDVVNELLEANGERRQTLETMQQFLYRFVELCRAVQVLGELTPRALDAISGMGEQMSARVLAAYLRQLGHSAQAVDATDLIVTDANFQSATPQPDPTRTRTGQRIRPLLAQDTIPIVTGFIAATEEGVTTTLGRGGSDFSAAVLGQALDAAEVWIWTGVDGVMSADPRLAPEARSIPRLTYREISELAYYGAKVIHPRTIRPCVENEIPLRIKNAFNPGHAGTVIVADDQGENGGVKAVAAIENLSLITVEGKGMIGVPGIAARTFGAVARGDVSILLISQASSEQSISFATPDVTAEAVIGSLEEEFAAELRRRDIDRIWAQHDVAIVTAVGAGLRGTPGIAGRIFTALGQEEVNIIAIAQGSSECSISMVVAGEQMETAVASIHSLI